MFRAINLTDIATLRAAARPKPIPPPLEETFERFKCMACWSYSLDNIVFHVECGRPICLDCLEHLATSPNVPNAVCGTCRGPIWNINHQYQEQLPLNFVRPTPNESWFMEELILYHCDECNSKMKYQIAVTHSHLEFEDRHPAVVNPPSRAEPEEEKVVRHEIVSNPVSRDTTSKLRAQFLVRIDGKRLWVRFYPRSKTVLDLRRAIAESTQRPIDKISVYKFIHVKLEDSATLHQVSIGDGLTHLAASTSEIDMENRNVNLYLRNIGEPPEVNHDDGLDGHPRQRRRLPNREMDRMEYLRTIQRPIEPFDWGH